MITGLSVHAHCPNGMLLLNLKVGRLFPVNSLRSAAPFCIFAVTIFFKLVKDVVPVVDEEVNPACVKPVIKPVSTVNVLAVWKLLTLNISTQVVWNADKV